MRARKNKNSQQRGFIEVVAAVVAGATVFLGTAAFSAGIQGDFQGVNGKSGDDSGGGIISDGGDGCYFDTSLDMTTATATKVQGTITGYYSPRQGQAHYNKGNYADEKEMNAPNDPRTASGFDVAKGAAAVDRSKYPFGTVFEIEGYGKFVAVDTGGKVNGTHLDLWSGVGDAGLLAANTIGNRSVIIKVYSWPGLSNDQLKKGIKRVCGAGMASVGKGCPAVAANATNIGSQLEKRNFSTYDYLPGVTKPNYNKPGRYWCTDLVHDSYKQAGFDITENQSAAFMSNWFKENAIYFVNGSGEPKPGDLIDMFQDGGSGHHVGVVVSSSGNCITTAEANTLGRNPKKYCLVGNKYYRSSGEIYGFGRLKNCQ